MNIHSKINELNNEQLQDLLWKVKKATAEGFDSPHTSVSIYWDPGIPGYRLAVPYSKEFVTLMKALIPDNERAYDQATKTWTVLENYYFSVLRAVLGHFPPNLISKIQSRKEYEALVAASMASPSEPVLNDLQKAAFAFVANLDLESLSAAYKKRAISLHPDHNGSADDFAEFNAAYQILKKEISK